MIECPTCLIYDVNEDLGIILTVKATDDVTLILTREDDVDQEGELVLIERASDQEPKS